MEYPNAKVHPMDEDRLSMISRMSQAVDSIPRKDIVELKAFASPPAGVVDAMEAVLILLGYKQTEVNWQTAKKLMAHFGPESLQKRIAAVDPESVPEDRRKRAMDILSKYNVERMTKISLAVASVYEWALAVSED